MNSSSDYVSEIVNNSTNLNLCASQSQRRCSQELQLRLVTSPTLEAEHAAAKERVDNGRLFSYDATTFVIDTI